MTKSELIEALSGVDNNSEILFGDKRKNYVGQCINRIYINSDGIVILTNNNIDININTINVDQIYSK